MATLHDVLLRQRELAAFIFEFQFGVYEDMLCRFQDYAQLTVFASDFYAGSSGYELDPAFRTSLPLFTMFGPRMLFPDVICLHETIPSDHFPLHIAIAEGDVHATQRILACRPDLAFQEAIAAAATHGHLDILTHLLRCRDDRTLDQLGINFDDASQDRPSRGLDSWLPRKLLEKDNNAVLRLLWDHRQANWPNNLLQHAVEKGAAQATSCLYERMPDAIYAHFMNDAAKLGLLAIVQDLHNRGEACTTDAMDQAAAKGHLEVVQFLHEHRTEGCTVDAMDKAIANGHVDVVRFLCEHRTEGASPNALDAAAASGNLALVTYLHAHGAFGATTLAVDKAVANGHLEILRFLLTHRSEGGSRDVVVHKAITCGRNVVILDLVAAGYPLPTNNIRLNECIVQPHAIEVLQLLVDHGVLLSPNMIASPSEPIADEVFDAFDTLMQATNPEASWTLQDVILALLAGATERIQKLWVRQPELRDKDLLHVAVTYGHEQPQSLQWLLDEGLGDPRSLILEGPGVLHWEVLQILLPHCMKDGTAIDNLIFLVEWCVKAVQSLWCTKSHLLLLKSEMVRQATAAHCHHLDDAGSDISDLAASLLARGGTTMSSIDGSRALFKTGIADWGLTTLVVHFLSADATGHVHQLVRWIHKITDDEMKAHLEAHMNESLIRLGHQDLLAAAVQAVAQEVIEDEIWP